MIALARGRDQCQDLGEAICCTRELLTEPSLLEAPAIEELFVITVIPCTRG